MNTAYLGTGGNEGHTESFLEYAENHLLALGHKILSKSKIYETSAWGNHDQPNFLNRVIKIETSKSPEELLADCLFIEKSLGRERKDKWGPRKIDIDILFFNAEIIRREELTIPHPFIQERKFVLVPLNEIAESFLHPVLNKTIFTLLMECEDKLNVNVYETN